MTTLHLLSGGAAQGLVTGLQARFKAEQGHDLHCGFGAVGVMKDTLLSGAPCDVLILTQALIEQLTASGQVRAGSARGLGRVKTGVAVPTGEAQPAVSTPDALRAALRAAQGIYFPDPVKATAGIHFMNVLKQLGLDVELAAKLRPFANGAAAMAALAAAAQAGEKGLVGCTQITEILFAPGVDWVGPLPVEFELATIYTAGVTTQSKDPQAASALIDLLTTADNASRRADCGFE